ncbi:hypothetical protein SERN_0004 [Serinibacter arcticus]|uniref:Uridine kinase n=1 Tax=Serinibacter arcticus TaxID=1655435 RepID=A0A4Z1E4W5_9MICO|nr:hypothetical protein SERN_0004 [Serinibacter arcticus]
MTAGESGAPVPASSPDLAAAVVDAVLVPGAPRVHDGVALLCIDGLAGAGKTTLAGQVAEVVAARGGTVAVVHMDDLYEGWGGLLEAGTEVVRVVEQLERSGTATYRRWDWESSARAETVHVPRSDVVVVEGCGSAPPRVDGVAALVVWITAPDELRLARGLERDGEGMRDDWRAFMADERALRERDATDERADVVLDATGHVLRWSRAPGGTGDLLWEDRGHG